MGKRGKLMMLLQFSRSIASPDSLPSEMILWFVANLFKGISEVKIIICLKVTAFKLNSSKYNFNQF